MARGNPLQGIRNKVARATLRIGACLVLERADAPCELVPRLLLAALEHQCPRVRLGQAGHPLELGDLGALRLLELLLELPDVFLPVGEPLIAARELLELLLDLELLRQNALLDLQNLSASVDYFNIKVDKEIGVDLASQPHGLLARFDLRLAPHGLPFASCVFEELVADPASLCHSGRAEDGDGEQGQGGASGDPDGNSDPDQHCRLLGRGLNRRSAVRPIRRWAWPAAIREASFGGQLPAEGHRATARVTSVSSGLSGRSSDVVSEKLLLQAKRRMECVGILPRLRPLAQTRS